MSMWFEVVVEHIDGFTRLGSWSYCQGLGVTFEVDKISSAVSSRRTRSVPKELTFSDVTLRRAMERTESYAIQQWLNRVVKYWMVDDGSDRKQKFPGTTVHISLYSDLRSTSPGEKSHLVAQWRLERAFPKTWRGPTLDANGNQVAVEELVFSHDGFLDEVTEPGATIVLTGPDGGTLEVEFFDGLTFEQAVRSPKGVASGASAGSSGMATTSGPTETRPQFIKDDDPMNKEKLNISFKATFDGRGDVLDADTKLLAWLKRESLPTNDGSLGKEPELGFKLGIGEGAVERTVILRRVNTSYLRFTSKGLPSRASYALSFEVASSSPGSPTSSAGSPPSWSPASPPTAARTSAPMIGRSR